MHAIIHLCVKTSSAQREDRFELEYNRLHYDFKKHYKVDLCLCNLVMFPRNLDENQKLVFTCTQYQTVLKTLAICKVLGFQGKLVNIMLVPLKIKRFYFQTDAHFHLEQKITALVMPSLHI